MIKTELIKQADANLQKEAAKWDKLLRAGFLSENALARIIPSIAGRTARSMAALSRAPGAIDPSIRLLRTAATKGTTLFPSSMSKVPGVRGAVKAMRYNPLNALYESIIRAITGKSPIVTAAMKGVA